MSDDEQLRELSRPVVGTVDLEDGRAAIAARVRRARVFRSVGAAAAMTLIVSLVVASLWTAHNRGDDVSVATKRSVPASAVDDLLAAARASGLPEARDLTSMAYDERRHEVVLFGGEHRVGNVGTDLADTWLFDKHGWREVHPATSPPARFSASMAYDPLTGTVVLYGGIHRVGQGVPGLTDTWTWDGTTWQERQPAHVPPWFTPAPLAFDLTTRSLTMLAPPPDYPGSHPEDGSFAPDALGRASRFDRWIWSGDDWRAVRDATSPAISFGVYVWDAPSRQMVYTDYEPPSQKGGCGFSHECIPPDPTGARYATTWTFDGKRWTHRKTKAAPRASSVAFSLPPDGAATVIDGSRAWAWRMNDWSAVQHDLTASSEASAAVDVDDGAVVVFGGFGSPNMWIGDGRGWTTVTPSPTAPTTTRPRVPVTVSVKQLGCTDPRPVRVVLRLSNAGSGDLEIEVVNRAADTTSTLLTEHATVEASNRLERELDFDVPGAACPGNTQTLRIQDVTRVAAVSATIPLVFPRPGADGVSVLVLTPALS